MKTIHLTYALLALLLLQACKPENKFETKTAESNGYSYEFVTNDPLNVRIYTLKNGLKVYLSQYKAEPRIMTAIAVKAGGKFDPANATGLAHYLEHIMFKGTSPVALAGSNFPPAFTAMAVIILGSALYWLR